MKKLQLLGLKVVQQPATNRTTTSCEVILLEELFSVAEVIGMLADSTKVLQASGLSKTEAMRLDSLIQVASVHQVKD